jgi:hypothetical protein
MSRGEQRFSFTVQADSEEEAIAKLVADQRGDDCPCNLPQWGYQSALDAIVEYGTMEGVLCMCIGERSEYEQEVADERN